MHQSTLFLLIMNELTNSFAAIAIGIGAGVLLTIPVQKTLNNLAVNSCASKPTHHLVVIKSPTGNGLYCINKKYN